MTAPRAALLALPRREVIGDAELCLGDARETLEMLPGESVHCCVTSPPYYGLRDYGVEGQIGLEKSPAEYVEKLVGVFREVRRVLRNDGTLWVVIGDSYATQQSGFGASGGSFESERKGWTEGAPHQSRLIPPGLKPKDLIGIPWMLAFALRDDGWYLRSDIIWAKKAPMPESVTDRPTGAHEHIFLLSKSARYFYDSEAVKEPFADERNGNPGRYSKTSARSKGATHDRQDLGFLNGGGGWNADGSIAGRNLRNVWHLGPKPFAGAHFATFPSEIPRRAILAGCPEGETVLDPFLGSGTTGVVASELGRRSIGVELNPDFLEMAKGRIEAATRQGRLFDAPRAAPPQQQTLLLEENP